MKVKILSLKGREFDGQVTGVVARTTSGEITILDNHLPIISILRPGTITILGGDEPREISVTGGFLEMNHKNELTILVS